MPQPLIRPTTPTDSIRGFVPAVAMGAVAAMWATAYISMMQPGLVIGEVLFGLLGIWLIAAGVVVGRYERRWLVCAATVGIFVAVVNALIIGSLLRNPETGRLHDSAPLWLVFNLVGSMLLVAVGAVIGSQSPRISHGNWLMWFLIVASAAVFLLLITGGLVTGLEAGLAVPDWPGSFGHNMFLFPLAQMKGGVYYEHAHRLYGSLVGLTSIIMMVVVFRAARPEVRWLRWVSIGVFTVVCIQGILGGTRVTEQSITLAIIHGVLAQVIFATVAGMAAVASTSWLTAARREPPNAEAQRLWATALPFLLIGQLVLGALYRHLNADAAVHIGVRHSLLLFHVLMALAVTGVTILAAGRAWADAESTIRGRLGGMLLALVGIQFCLGVGAFIAVWSRGDSAAIPVLEVVITTAHQATGALLLALATLLMLWTRRLLAPSSVALQVDRAHASPAA